MIIYYTKSCGGCSGNRAIANMKSYCNKAGIEFMERRTILFIGFKEEAEEIMEATGITLPFFYGTESQTAINGNSLTTLNSIEYLIRKESRA